MKKKLKTITIGIALTAFASVAHASLISEVAGNNTLATAQNVNGNFSTGANSIIGSQWGIDPTIDEWVSIENSISDGSSFDYYRFSNNVDGGTISMDIDFGGNHDGFVDTEVGIWSLDGSLLAYSLVSDNDDSSDTYDALTGVYTLGAGIDPGTTSSFDSGLRILNLNAGDYVVGVGEWDTSFSHGGMTGNSVDATDTYTLHITREVGVSDSGTTLSLFSISAGLLMLVARKRANRRG